MQRFVSNKVTLTICLITVRGLIMLTVVPSHPKGPILSLKNLGSATQKKKYIIFNIAKHTLVFAHIGLKLILEA